MRVLAWVAPATWPAVVEALNARHAADDVTLVAVVGGDPGPLGPPLLGRAHPHRDDDVAGLVRAEAERLLEQAAGDVRPPCTTAVLAGPPERVLTEAAARADLLLLARDGDVSRPGPHSLGRQTRFVLDHTTCAVELVWPSREGPDTPR